MPTSQTLHPILQCLQNVDLWNGTRINGFNWNMLQYSVYVNITLPFDACTHSKYKHYIGFKKKLIQCISVVAVLKTLYQHFASNNFTVHTTYHGVFTCCNAFYRTQVFYKRPCGSVKCWGTMQQTRRSRVWVSMQSINFFNLPNPSSHNMAQGFTEPLIEMTTRR
jgi:hypothetical protein